MFASYLSGKELQPFYVYGLIILILIVADILSKGNPVRMLLLFINLFIFCLIYCLFLLEWVPRTSQPVPATSPT